MSYCLPADVRMAVAPNYCAENPATPPSKPSNTAADLSNDILASAIQQAESRIDSYLGGRYNTPVTPNPDGSTPHPVDFLAIAFASYYATLTFRRGQDLADTDPIVRRYLDAQQTLTDTARGTISLPIPGQGGPQADVGAGSPINPYTGELFTSFDFTLNRYPWAGGDLSRPGVWPGGNRW